MVRLRLGDWESLGRVIAVSIPLWCDCDYDVDPGDVPDANVSIPLWCDCDNRLSSSGVTFSLCFNPTMVRLRQIMRQASVACHSSFQSHYGAIATPPWPAGPAGHGSSFNPTMVRLRPSRKRCDVVAETGFNPTMVRLRPMQWKIEAAERCRFQSHYGAIATCTSGPRSMGL